MSKRPADDASEAGSSGQPPFKKVQFEPLRIGPVSTLEEMDMKVLQYQNKKLAQRLEQRVRTENDLRQRIEQLEKRQTQDDAVLNVINRYWNQLNEDIRVLLQRFDAETADESETKNESEATTSFLMQLSTWDKEELDEKLANRVQVSKRAVAKIIQAFDRLMQRNEKITMVLKGEVNENGNSGSGGESTTTQPPNLDETIRQVNVELQAENRNLQTLNTSLHEKHHFISLKMAELQEKVTAKETENAELQNRLDDLQYELQKAQQRNDKLEHHLAEAMEKVKACQQSHGDDKGSAAPTPAAKAGAGASNSNAVSQKKLEELQKDVEEQRELATNRLQELEKLHQQHRDALKDVERLKMDIRQLPESVIVETTEYKCLQSQFSVLYNESMQLKTQLEDARLQLQSSKNSHLRQIEQMESEELLAQKKLRTEVIQLEDMLAQVRKEYEMLRIEFEQNLAANEQTGPINREMRHLITSLQNHNQQLKGEIHRYKKRYKDCNNDICRLKKELDEAHMKQQQAAEIKEMAAEAAIKEEEKEAASAGGGGGSGSGGAAVQVKEESGAGGQSGAATSSGAVSQANSNATVMVKKEEEDGEGEEADSKEGVLAAAGSGAAGGNAAGAGGATSGGGGGSGATGSGEKSSDKERTQSPVKKEKGETSSASTATVKKEVKREVKVEKDHRDKEIHRLKEARAAESEMIRDLKAQLKKALNEQKELKLLLDMYKGVGKEQRDKVQLMAAEKKARAETEDLRSQLKKLQESKREERKKLADEDALRKIKQQEEQVHQLQRQVAAQKQEEEALLNEMEVTGQAFEDMQEQNSRLIQQLREKDDANFKLMSERIKSNQLHKLAREEKDILIEQVNTLTTQVEAQNQVVRKLEEKERFLQNTLATAEKELSVRQQALEMHKRKAIESAQSAADLKLHLEKYHAQVKEAQQVVAEKTSALEAEAYKTKRLQEEIAQLRRKLERLKKIEMAGTADEVMMEEIREYKDILTCPSCKVKRKDAVLSKCFHVFCFDCLRTRYETRQRKCPKCNAAFGANDYHRLYLS